MQIFVMMLGELEYESIYYPESLAVNLSDGKIEDNTESQSFKFTAHMMLVFFVVTVSMVIMNLLVGLAVNDIQVISTSKPCQLDFEKYVFFEKEKVATLYHNLRRLGRLGVSCG